MRLNKSPYTTNFNRRIIEIVQKPRNKKLREEKKDNKKKHKSKCFQEFIFCFLFTYLVIK